MASLFLSCLLDLSGLHNGRMQIQVVRHNRSSDDANGDIEHGRVLQNFGARHESVKHATHIRFRQKQVDAKTRAMVAISTITRVSSARNPLFCNTRMSNTSTAVMITPYNMGMLNRSLRAMAEPMTSARSVAAIASSHKIHNITTTGTLKRSRQA